MEKVVAPDNSPPTKVISNVSPSTSRLASSSSSSTSSERPTKVAQRKMAAATSFGRQNPTFSAANRSGDGHSGGRLPYHLATDTSSSRVQMLDPKEMMDEEELNDFYYVQEPKMKRRHEEEDMFNAEYAPRPKRKFERINERLQNFSISRDGPLLSNGTASMDTSSDEEFDDLGGSCSGPSPVGIIEEPDEEDQPPKKIRIDEKLKAYLERARAAREPLFDRLHHTVRGDEVAVWRPTGLNNPFDDPSMRGRISEIDEPADEEDWQDDVAFASFPDETSTEPDGVEAQDVSSVSSHDGSPAPTPPLIEELTASPDYSPISPQSEAGEEQMEID